MVDISHEAKVDEWTDKAKEMAAEIMALAALKAIPSGVPGMVWTPILCATAAEIIIGFTKKTEPENLHHIVEFIRCALQDIMNDNDMDIDVIFRKR